MNKKMFNENLKPVVRFARSRTDFCKIAFYRIGFCKTAFRITNFFYVCGTRVALFSWFFCLINLLNLISKFD